MAAASFATAPIEQASDTVEAYANERTKPRPVVEFLAVGGLTPLLFAVSWILRGTLGLSEAELTVGFSMFLVAHVVNDPHFAVTYLLFYEDFRKRAFGDAFTRTLRLGYWGAGVWVPLCLLAWGLSALLMPSLWSMGLLIQLMFLLVGFHYVKQGFGVLLVLSARRQVFFARAERNAILAHAYAGWAYAWASPFDPGRTLEEKGVPYSTFAHPTLLEPVTRGLFWLTFVIFALVLAHKLRRERGFALLTPIVGFMCSVWAWSVYASIDPLVRYAIPALHSLQYLYMVWLLKGNQAREREGPPWFEKPVLVRMGVLALSALALGWLLFRGAPPALDGAFAVSGGELGPTPYFAALYAFVNIHHYCMDTVIWRKDNPLTRYLRQHATVRNVAP